MARRVARAMDHVELKLTHRYLVTIKQPAVRLERFGMHAPAFAVIIELGNPEPVFLMRAFDRYAQLFGQNSGLPAVIEVPMRDEQLFNRHAALLNRGLQPVEIATRIDQRALHRFGAPDQRAILLERGDGHDAHAHRRFGFGIGHETDLALCRAKRNRIKAARFSRRRGPQPQLPQAARRSGDRPGCR